jgi:hypothetical protein
MPQPIAIGTRYKLVRLLVIEWNTVVLGIYVFGSSRLATSKNALKWAFPHLPAVLWLFHSQMCYEWDINMWDDGLWCLWDGDWRVWFTLVANKVNQLCLWWALKIRWNELPPSSSCSVIISRPDELGMRYKLMRWWIVMPLGLGLMDFAHLGCSHVEQLCLQWVLRFGLLKQAS